MNLWDYYRILGVKQNATDDEIRKAYRKKAMEYHPDRNSSPDSQEMFIRITEAYEYLISHPYRRNITEEEVRRIDDALSVLLLEATLDDLLAGAARGVAQDEAGASWWTRRRAEDSRLDPTRSVAELFDHLRALPAEAPAFFEHRGERIKLLAAYVTKLAAGK